jgi:hypothetical protein
MDIYFNTGGIEGTYWCAAYTEGTSIATQHISTQTLHATTANAPRSKNYIRIDAKAADKDHVITLNQLTPDTVYDVYCHGNDALVNGNTNDALRTFWTAPNPTLWDVSLVRSILTPDASTQGTLTITFSHGRALGQGSIIKLTTVTTALFGSAANNNGGAGCSSDQLTFHSQGSSGTQLIFTLTTTSDAAGTSAAGTTVVITCNTNLLNPSSTTTVFYKLAVSGHNAEMGLEGPSFA